MNDAWNRAIAAGWHPPEDDGFWWREIDGKREVSYRTPEWENMDAQDGYRIQCWNDKVWVFVKQLPWREKDNAINAANDLHKQTKESYRVLDRLMRPVYIVPPPQAEPDDYWYERWQETAKFLVEANSQQIQLVKEIERLQILLMPFALHYDLMAFPDFASALNEVPQETEAHHDAAVAYFKERGISPEEKLFG